MAVDIDPIVNQWYKQLDKQEHFKVLSVDEDNALVEIQNKQGTVQEIDIDDWFEMDLTNSEAPDEWEHSFDYIPSGEISDEDWIIPSEAIQPEENQGVDEYWDEGFQEIDPFEKNM